MPRTPNPFKRLAVLTLLWCSGCASHHKGHPVATNGSPPIAVDDNDNGGLATSLLQDASGASLNNWNFRKLGW